MKIARRFNGGSAGKKATSPGGTAEAVEGRILLIFTDKTILQFDVEPAYVLRAPSVSSGDLEKSALVLIFTIILYL
jgi:hypothetical protein